MSVTKRQKSIESKSVREEHAEMISTSAEKGPERLLKMKIPD